MGRVRRRAAAPKLGCLALLGALLLSCRGQAPNEAEVGPAEAPTAGPDTARTPAAPLGASPAPTALPDGDPSLPGLTGAPAVDAALARHRASKGDGYRPRTHHLHPDGRPIYTNRLITTTSPYLLQHAHNPVNWYPWGEAAFERAKALNRPILLSVGYSTCHWCHVMERESFEDNEIAAFVNTHFVAIKVDRETRPDVDALYMNAVHMLAGRGGWPMTVVMTPAGEPFFAGTYFPARDGDRGARKGFLSILRELSQRYRTDEAGVVAQAQRITMRLQAAARPRPPTGVPGPDVLVRAAEGFARRFDARNGGFGQRPKFPRPSVLDFLLRYHRRTGDPHARHMAVHTLRRMAAGGMHDHLGGGFHRYSVDARWLVPHFEKMLYDNAQLALAYLDGYQVTGAADLQRVARSILDYVAAEMRAPGGAFYSATDADSANPEGHTEEGWFFTWTPAEVEAVVGAAGLATWRQVYPLTDRGNFEGRNILHTPRALEVVARGRGQSVDGLLATLAPLRSQLYAHRATRPPPLLDDKIITAWNGQMIAAFARGGRVLNAPSMVGIARGAADFLLQNMRRPDGRVRRIWSAGAARGDGYLDDHAYLIAGLIELYEATGEARWFTAAVELQRAQDAHFRDRQRGGYFTTADDAETLLAREKPDYDGAQPSGNSIAAQNLLRLWSFVGDPGYRSASDALLSAFAADLRRNPQGLPAMMAALEMRHDLALQVVLVSADRAAAAPLRAVVARTYLPNRAVVDVDSRAAVDQQGMIPLLTDKRAQGGATAYVCERGRCERPTGDPAVLAEQLARRQPLLADQSPSPLAPPRPGAP